MKKSNSAKLTKCTDGSCTYCNPLDRKLVKALSKLDYKDTRILLTNLTSPIQHKIAEFMDNKKMKVLDEANDNIGRIIGQLQIQLLKKQPKSINQKRPK